jgi:primary-amine oxidase
LKATVSILVHLIFGIVITDICVSTDCPWGSTFWNLTYHSGNGSVINTNSLCIFEADMNFPLSRHRTGASNKYGFSKLGTVKGAQLIVRAIATVGNYDYMFDYGFHME